MKFKETLTLIGALLLIVGIPSCSAYYKIKMCGVAGLFVECRITAEVTK